MMLHRMWARRIAAAMATRRLALEDANATALLRRQRQVRRKLRRLLGASEPRKAPAMRLAGALVGARRSWAAVLGCR